MKRKRSRADRHRLRMFPGFLFGTWGVFIWIIVRLVEVKKGKINVLAPFEGGVVPEDPRVQGFEDSSEMLKSYNKLKF